MPLLKTRRSTAGRRREADDHVRRAPRLSKQRRGEGQPPIIEVEDATVVYPGGQVALDRVSIEIGRGEFAFVVGPTGCGKSTLIKTLIREVEPADGRVRIAGKDINQLDHDRTPYLRRRIGTVFQDFKLLPEPNRLRQRRLCAAGDRRATLADSQQGARDPPPGRAAGEDPQLSG